MVCSQRDVHEIKKYNRDVQDHGEMILWNNPTPSVSCLAHEFARN